MCKVEACRVCKACEVLGWHSYGESILKASSSWKTKLVSGGLNQMQPILRLPRPVLSGFLSFPCRWRPTPLSSDLQTSCLLPSGSAEELAWCKTQQPCPTCSRPPGFCGCVEKQGSDRTRRWPLGNQCIPGTRQDLPPASLPPFCYPHPPAILKYKASLLLPGARSLFPCQLLELLPGCKTVQASWIPFYESSP